VRHVTVTGNRRTKDKVIRRELTVRPGETFRRSVVARSQRDVFALGYFEDVLIDYQVVPNSTDIDLEFAVKEKTTGTASAGAGYANDIGLTGFVQLGIPNFLGNGQSVSLHLERGGTDGKQQNYSLSFTEPWFLDSPTVLGADASYSTTKPLGFPYLETTKGGGIRLGRRLPWIDYTRGFFSLRSEQLRRSDFDSLAVATDSSGYLVNLRDSLDYPVTVSSTSFSMVRNSTDNPFYPRNGSRVTLTEELAGGPLGGFYKYHKTYLDARRYFSLPAPPALMLRVRSGYVQGGTQRTPGDRIPDYERFRLGGTTSSALRGYDDNSIVPAGNSLFKGGRFMTVYTAELQFLIANPLHGVLFVDAGNTWNSIVEAQPLKLKVGWGPGIRMEIPGLGPIGFDYAYGVDRKKWQSHFVLGAAF
jgi:outer membrane protein insertion porin family